MQCGSNIATIRVIPTSHPAPDSTTPQTCQQPHSKHPQHQATADGKHYALRHQALHQKYPGLHKDKVPAQHYRDPEISAFTEWDRAVD